jgi:hypothetical protein
MANEQAVLYASPNGSGTACTLGSPCSLTAVRDKVRTINSAMTGDIVVYLRGGTYTLGSTFTLTNQDSGTNSYQVIYRAYPGETPVISGGRVIAGWTLHDSGKNIYKANVGSLNTRQIFVNGVRATRARGETNPAGFSINGTNTTKPGTGLYGNMQNWGNISNIEIVAFWEWKSFRLPVVSISGNTIRTKISVSSGANRVTWIENAYELLDSEGEFYLNRTTGELFYKPRAGENMATAYVVAPVLETLIRGTGTLANPIRNIQFHGLTFSYATWSAPSTDGYNSSQAGVIYNDPNRMNTPSNLEFRAVTNMRFERNVFTHLGATAISFEFGTQNNALIGNKFEDVSGGAIRVGSVSDAGATGTAAVKNNMIQNNYINKIGLEYHDNCAVFAGYTDTTIVDHNEITDIPYTGVSVGWGWTHTNYPNLRNNKVTNNLIYEFMKVLRDGGGVYMLSRQDGTVINNNYIHHNRNEFGTIYLDQGCENITIANNVLAYNFSNYIFIQDSVPPNAYNNTVINTFVNNGRLRVYSQNSVSGTTVVTGDNWPPAARAIMNNAGLQSAYADIKGNTPTPPTPNPGSNIALNKPASSSSAYSVNHTSDKGNDGNTGTLWSTTSADTNGWWQVDLGDVYTLNRIEIVARQDLDQPFARMNFEIRGSVSGDFNAGYSVLGRQAGSPFPHKGTWTVTLPGTQSFRYLRLVVFANRSGMNFAEFRVFGDKAPVGNVTNVALNKPASSSSVYSVNHTANKGNDGDTGTLWSTTSADTNGWWQVDLGALYKLSRIEVVARQDVNQSFARMNFEVRGSVTADFNSGYTVLGRQGGSPFPHQGTWSVTLSGDQSFRYLRLVVFANRSGMNFAEFRAFGS